MSAIVMRKKDIAEIEGREVTLSNLDKPMFPVVSFTKGEVIDFYIKASDFILPHLANRPITLKRFPDGVGKEAFYEKNAPSHTPEWVKTTKVPRSNGGYINYILVNDLATLVWTANLANIEMHTLLSKVPKLSQPSFVVFDLDPGPGVGVLQCAELAIRMREVLKSLKLSLYAKGSGSKGMQLYVPLNTKSDFDTTSAFAKTFAQELERAAPALYVSRMSKALRKGKIFIDWSQNSESKTTVCVYSMRAKRDRPYISLPFEWSEIEAAVKKGDEARFYLEPKEALRRLEKKGDLFEPLLSEKQTLKKAHIDKLPETIEELLSENTASTSTRKIASNRKGKLGKKVNGESSLAEYRRKRNFSQTSEPPPAVKKESKELIFVIQKHQASHLHFDFRLEMKGVLKSWAIPKGPPLAHAEKRLAMLVEDHPVDYAQFEGIIPEGNYGAGTVMVWDYGTYACENAKPLAGFFAGKLVLQLRGKKLQGDWHLVRTSGDAKKWLLLMGKTAKIAVSKRQIDRSVLTGRTLAEIEKDRSVTWQSNRAAKKKSRR